MKIIKQYDSLIVYNVGDKIDINGVSGVISEVPIIKGKTIQIIVKVDEDILRKQDILDDSILEYNEHGGIKSG